MPLPLPRLGLKPRSPFLHTLPAFPPIKPHNHQPIQPKQAAMKPSHILKKDSAMFCFMVSVKLTVDLGLLCHISLKRKRKDCVHSPNIPEKQLSCTHWKLHFLSLLVRSFCRLYLLQAATVCAFVPHPPVTVHTS